MANEVNNCFLVNAPAGSGKTTQIKAMIKQFITDNPKDNILCITYTNRAADELSRDIKTPNVFIGTIHSFLHAFMKRYFRSSFHPQVIICDNVEDKLSYSYAKELLDLQNAIGFKINDLNKNLRRHGDGFFVFTKISFLVYPGEGELCRI